MLLRTIYDDRLAQAAYLVGCQRTGEALLIDPERDVEKYIDLARREGLRIIAVAETHIHADFLSGAREMAERTGAKLYLSGEGGSDWSYRWLDARSNGGSYDHKLLHDGDHFSVGQIDIRVLHTPGHTPEHICFEVTDTGGGATEPMGIATGDFVFVGDVGRPDLLETAAGSAGAKEPAAHDLYCSLGRFISLPEYMQVWPGHGAGSACGKALGAIPQSTVGYEKRFNSAVKSSTGDADKFIADILEGQPEPPVYFARMKRENRDGPALLKSMPRPRRIDAADIERAIEESVVLDTRTRTEWSTGHLHNSIHAPHNKAFPTIAGSYVEPERTIILVINEAHVADAVADLVHVGLDNVIGYITPESMRDAATTSGLLQHAQDIDAASFAGLLDRGEGLYVLDVRSAVEHADGHIDGAINIAHTRLAARLNELPNDRTIHIHCQSGARASAASSYLKFLGFDVVNVASTWPEISAMIELSRGS